MRKVSKYGVFSDPYFPVFSPNTRKYGVEKTPYFDTFNALNNNAIKTKLRFSIHTYSNLCAFRCFSCLSGYTFSACLLNIS